MDNHQRRNQIRNARKFQQKKRRSDAWVRAITEAGAKAATVGDEEELIQEITHLVSLRQYLDAQRDKWHRVPGSMPPKYDGILLPLLSSLENPNPGEAKASGSSSTIPRLASSNPFAAIGDEDEESEEESLSSLSSAKEEKTNKNVNSSYSSHYQKTEDDQDLALMTMRRLFVRVMTTLSELHARLANLRNQQDRERWTEGVEGYATAMDCLEQALVIAETEHARLLSDDQQLGPIPLKLAQTQLAEDVQVVRIAVEYFGQQQDRFSNAAQKRRGYLTKKLLPQWKDRDEVKERLGDRWNNNPSPKMDFAKLRQANEQELKAIERAVARLEELQSNAELAHERSNAIGGASSGSTSRCSSSSILESVEPTLDRYNKLRPAYPQYEEARVALEVYPDPVAFGWTFTGSNQETVVEYFEKAIKSNNNETKLVVQLDWYYTTGAIQTTMDHPALEGQVLLFCKEQVTPVQYLHILQDPRAHANVRSRAQSYHGGKSNGNINRQNQQGRAKGRRGKRGRGRGLFRADEGGRGSESGRGLV